MSRKSKLTKGGIVTNLDAPLDAKTQKEVHEAERQTAIVEDAKREAKARGGDTFGVYSDAEIESGKANLFTSKEYANLDPRQMGGLPRLKASIRITPDGFQWALSDKELDAVAAGYFCPGCLIAQERQQVNMCRWRDRPADSDIPGCGFSKIADQNIGTEAYK